MFRPHALYTLAEAQEIAFLPIVSFVEMVSSSHPEAATVGKIVIAQAQANLYDIGSGLAGGCGTPLCLVYTGFAWESVRCRGCANLRPI